MTMWGQPPSAVRASEARQDFLSTFPNLEFHDNLAGINSPLAHNSH
jgi:hypothetical protein